MSVGKRRLLLVSTPAFVLAEIVLGVLLQTAGWPHAGDYSLAAVILSCLFCVSAIEKSPRYIFTQAALLFTLMADSVLVYNRTEHYVGAMCAFSLAQLSYAARLLAEEPPRLRRIHLAVRAGVIATVLAATAAVLGGGGDALAYISLFYFANLLANAAFATCALRREPLFAVGLWLFVLCDIFVGFSMLGAYLPLPDTPLFDFLASPPINMAWVFYLPCLILLALSPIRWRRK